MNELALQQTWLNLSQSQTELRTDCGKSFSVIKPGILNHTDGPDFRNAELRCGRDKMYGSIEFHIRQSDWFSHNHHNDRSYDQVILHIYLIPGSRKAETKSGWHPFEINLTAYLDNFTFQTKNNTKIPCYEALKAVPLNTKVLQYQEEKAIKTYFKSKTEYALSFYPTPAPSIETSVKQILTSTFCLYTTSSYNRAILEDLCKKNLIIPQTELFLNKVKAIKWNSKSVQPAWQIHNLYTIWERFFDFADKIRLPVGIDGFMSLNSEFETFILGQKGIGRKTRSNLIRCSWLPTLYIFTELTGQYKLASFLYNQWKDAGVHEIPFIADRFPGNWEQEIEQWSRFTTYQWKSYCSMQGCHKCELFKIATSA